MPTPFRLSSNYEPQGDQPRAIDQLIDGLAHGEKHQVLLGITGSGKTFSVACVVEKEQRPTLVIAHNKTLAAQLYGEFKSLFPDNAVHYFVSYYDYYQPEAYVPSSDTYIEKDASINEDIDRLRHAATQSVLTRRDVLIVASVSCIFGIGSADDYRGMLIDIVKGQPLDRDKLLRALVDIQYTRNDYDFHRGTFRVRGDIVEVFPAHEEERAIRIEFFGNTIDGLWDVDPLRGKILSSRDRAAIFPFSHYVTSEERRKTALNGIRNELREQLCELKSQNRLIEEQRLRERTLFDLEMLEQMGYCNGIENYSRYLSGRQQGQPPPTLLDYFPNDFLMIIDESHQTIPQLKAMYKGDHSRKQTLVDYGFRLPSALDNRPLKFEEFLERINQVIYTSATPGDFELELADGIVVEQIIRPTGLVDPDISVRPISNQVDDLLEEIRICVQRNERVLITTLTKRMAEDLADYYQTIGIEVRYLHSDINTLERMKIIRELRQGVFDVLVGINLLREGLDLPEVSLVAILDADKEGFLRSTRALVQTIGRAARNLSGRVIMYADTITNAMHHAIEETNRRRQTQIQYNKKHGIVPQPVFREEMEICPAPKNATKEPATFSLLANVSLEQLPEHIENLRKQMLVAANELNFEHAAGLRDQIKELSALELIWRDPANGPSPRNPAKTSSRRIKNSK
ncbi:MAG: excinuclease ABC subunit UvrB [Pseudomonadota bacterium]